MTTHSPLTTVLQNAGLDPLEAQIYLTLLEVGALPASVIAKKTGLKRGHTYNLLAALVEKNVVQEVEKDGIRHFTGCLPPLLVSLLDRKEEEIEKQKQLLLQVIPDLERLRNPLASQPKVRFYERIDGIKEIYEDTLRTGDKHIYALGDFEHFFPKEDHKELNEWMWQYCKRRADKGIWYMGIMNKSPMTDVAYKRRVREKRKFKMLSGVALPIEVNIYGNKVAIVSSSKDMVGLLIEDQPTADALRNFHQAVWTLLPEYR